MKRYPLFLLVAFLGLLITVPSVSAHVGGPPYIKVNGEYSQSNPILTYVNPTAFTIGGDVASSSGYVVGTAMTFEIDEQFFPNPYRFTVAPANGTAPSRAVTPVFRWDFGDGSEKQEGENVTHAYQAPGTYFVGLEVKFPGKVEEFTGNNVVQIDVTPVKGYQLPKAAIAVNGKIVADPARDFIEIRPGKNVLLEASPLAGTIKAYQWDFGDETGSSDKTVPHAYKKDEYFPVFPVLRVVDNQGLISDTFVFLDTPLAKPNMFVTFFTSLKEFFLKLFTKS